MQNRPAPEAVSEPLADWQSKRRPSDVPRARKCLCCHTHFESQWSGERICKRCQSATAWKQGWGAP